MKPLSRPISISNQTGIVNRLTDRPDRQNSKLNTHTHAHTHTHTHRCKDGQTEVRQKDRQDRTKQQDKQTQRGSWEVSRSLAARANRTKLKKDQNSYRDTKRNVIVAIIIFAINIIIMVIIITRSLRLFFQWQILKNIHFIIIILFVNIIIIIISLWIAEVYAL